MKHTYGAISNKISLRPVVHTDIEKMRIWRNNEKISRYLRKIPYITVEMQNHWYEKYLADSNCFFFAIEDNRFKTVVGTLAIYNILGDKAEIGKIVIGDERVKGKGYGFLAMKMAMKIGYNYLGIRLYNLDCHEDNLPALKTYLKVGFKECGRHEFINGGNEIEMYMDYGMLEQLFAEESNFEIIDNFVFLSEI